MATSEKQKGYSKKYDTKFDRMVIRVPAGELDKIKAYAASKNESLAEMIRRLIKQEMGE